MLDKMFSSVNTLQRGLNASWLRNEVISNNIANVDTPGFNASHVRLRTWWPRRWKRRAAA
jgi:flagellar basal-body rod protein FlgB